MTVLQPAFMADAGKIMVWVVEDTSNHPVLVEFESTRGDIDRQIDEMANAVDWQTTWSMDFTLRDRRPLRMVTVAVVK